MPAAACGGSQRLIPLGCFESRLRCHLLDSGADSVRTAEGPNVVFILADDLEVGCA
jgi:hypothetical protein